MTWTKPTYTQVKKGPAHLPSRPHTHVCVAATILVAALLVAGCLSTTQPTPTPAKISFKQDCFFVVIAKTIFRFKIRYRSNCYWQSCICFYVFCFCYQ